MNKRHTARAPPMILLLQSWLWVAMLSGVILVVLFFSALHTHKARDEIFNKKLRLVGRTAGPPPATSDVAEYFLRKKRSFRSAYFFYALYLASTH